MDEARRKTARELDDDEFAASFVLSRQDVDLEDRPAGEEPESAPSSTRPSLRIRYAVGCALAVAVIVLVAIAMT